MPICKSVPEKTAEQQASDLVNPNYTHGVTEQRWSDKNSQSDWLECLICWHFFPNLFIVETERKRAIFHFIVSYSHQMWVV